MQSHGDKPVIQYIVEEAVRSGIESIIIVTGDGIAFLEKEKYELLRYVQSINALANIHYNHQQNLAGLGDAILCTEEFIGEDPFAVLLVDDIFLSKTPPITWYRLYVKSIIDFNLIKLIEKITTHIFHIFPR